MSSYKEERGIESCYQKFENKLKACIGFLSSFLISMIGGLILAWWELSYHPTNSQLWMVPLGLILFVTPLIICFSLFISNCCVSQHPDARTRDQLGFPLHNSVPDPER